MLSRALNRSLRILGVLVVLMLLFAGFGAWKWHRLIHPRADDLRAWDAAPVATVYLYYIPSIPAFYWRFFKYHQTSMASPTIEVADRRGQSNSILHRQPAQTIGPDLVDLMTTAGNVVLSEYFAALLPPADGTRDLSVLLGGKCLDPSLSSWMIRRTLSKKGFSWTKRGAGGTTFHVGSHEGRRVFVATMGEWIFLSQQMAAVANAIQAVGHRGEQTLGTSPAFQESRETTLRDSILWVYADISNCVASAAATGIPEAARVIAGQMPYLRAASYGFRTDGPHGIASDLISYTLDPRCVAAAAIGIPPIDPGFFRNVPDVTLSAMTGSVNFAEIAQWSLLNREEINRLAQAAPGSSSPARQFYRIITKDGPALRTTRWGAVDQAAAGRAPEWVTAAGELPGAPSPFFEIRFNYRGIVASLLEEMKADWAPWKKAGERLGLPMPDQPPSFNVADYLNWTRVTAGFEGNTLCIYHSLRLGKAGNTNLTALAELSAFFFEQEMSQRLDLLRKPFATLEGTGGPAWVNPLEVALVSGLFVSPVLTNRNGGTAAISVLMLDTLAGVTPAPAD